MNAPDARQFEQEPPRAHLRVPPHSIEAESAVLGGLMLRPDAWDRVGDLLTEEDFYTHAHKLIFAVIAKLSNACKEVDAITVHSVLQVLDKDGAVGGLPYVHSLTQYTPSAANLRQHALIVREKSVLRRLVAFSDETATAAFGAKGAELESLLEESVQKLLAIDIGVRDEDWEPISTGIVTVLDHIQDVASGHTKEDVIPLGIDALDERLDGGGRPGEVIVLGARPAMGKSALGATFGLSMALDGNPCAFWSGEMSKKQLWTRSMSMESHVHLSRLKRAERLRDLDWPMICTAVEKLKGRGFYVNDQPGLTIAKLRSKVRNAKRKHQIRGVVVDHLALLEPTDPKVPRHQQVGEITRGLKRMAKELGIVVILLVQLNRNLTQRADPTPQLSDLRESGDIEQDADIVMFLHRPFYYTPDLGDEWKYYAEIIVAKVRDGSPGTVPCMFIGENVRLMNWPADTPIPTNKVRTKRGASDPDQ